MDDDELLEEARKELKPSEGDSYYFTALYCQLRAKNVPMKKAVTIVNREIKDTGKTFNYKYIYMFAPIFTTSLIPQEYVDSLVESGKIKVSSPLSHALVIETISYAPAGATEFMKIFSELQRSLTIKSEKTDVTIDDYLK